MDGSANSVGSHPRSALAIPMAEELDNANLSDSLAFLRRQLEYFEATAEDVAARKGKGGKYPTVVAGQIGIRCIHCAYRPPSERSTGAVAYPTSTGLVYQAVRNWQSKLKCDFWDWSVLCDDMFVPRSEVVAASHAFPPPLNLRGHDWHRISFRKMP